jgi:DNA segregation ATPase FtsK/SpoIIIE-like protein
MNTRTQTGDALSPALSEKMKQLSRDTLWLGASVASAYLALALLSFDTADPGWSHAVTSSTPIHNLGGRPGAWIADLLLYLFGQSAWWLVALPFFRLWQSHRWFNQQGSNKLPAFYQAIPALLLLLTASATLECLRFYSHVGQLPLIAGGLIGGTLGKGLFQVLGFTGATLFALAALILGWNGFSGISLFRMTERMGELIETFGLILTGQRPSRSGRVVGQTAAQATSAPSSAAADAANPASAMPQAAGEAHESTPKQRFAGFGFFVRKSTQAASAAESLNPEDPPPGSGQPLPQGPARNERREPGFAQPQTVSAAHDAAYASASAESVPASDAIPEQQTVAAAPENEALALPAKTLVRIRLAAEQHGGPALASPVYQPQITLLEPPPTKPVAATDPESLEYISRQIERKLGDFGIKAKVIAARPGAAITRYEIDASEGGALKQVREQIHWVSRDLARSLSIVGLRVVDTVPDASTPCMALEIPNARRQNYYLRELVQHEDFQKPELPLILGRAAVGNQSMIGDLSRLGHLLIAGGGGSGRAESLHAMLLGLLCKLSPQSLRLILLDTRMHELSAYNDLPHLLTPLVSNKQRAEKTLSWCVAEIERRTQLVKGLGLPNLLALNQEIEAARREGECIPHPQDSSPLVALPSIVVAIEELADLIITSGKKIDEPLAIIARQGAAVGVHLLVSTQRPSVDVITSSVKATLPTRLVFKLGTKVESTLLLERSDAYDCLLGGGDFLLQGKRGELPLRGLAPMVTLDEIQRLLTQLRTLGTPQYVAEIQEGDKQARKTSATGAAAKVSDAEALYEKAIDFLRREGNVSATRLERGFGISYNKADELITRMEKDGIVSKPDRNGTRTLLETHDYRISA